MRVLIMEDPIIIPVLVKALEHVQRTDKIQLEPIIAPSFTEARERIRHVDFAIIGVESDGLDLADYALNSIGIPVIALGSLADNGYLVFESRNLKFIEKPSFPLTEFTQSVREIMEMIKNGQSRKQVAETLCGLVNRTIASQIPIRN